MVGSLGAWPKLTLRLTVWFWTLVVSVNNDEPATMRCLVLTIDEWTLVRWIDKALSEEKKDLHKLHAFGIDSEQNSTNVDLTPLGHGWQLNEFLVGRT